MSEATFLFDEGGHKNILLAEVSGAGEAVQANHHLIIHNSGSMILDPGGPAVFNKVMSEVMGAVPGGNLSHIFLSHQDPDIVAATNGWLLATDATAYVSKLWTRFVPHVVPSLRDGGGFSGRLKGIPDEGMLLDLDGAKLVVVPAHYLHSSGNFQIYDPVSKILYTGDLGASLGMDYREVPDFDAHIQYMEGFHKRYMPSSAALKAWAKLARKLDIEILAPQHGALMRGKPMVESFIAWCESLTCGIDALGELSLPSS